LRRSQPDAESAGRAVVSSGQTGDRAGLSQAGKAAGRFDICAVCGGITPENANIYSSAVRRRPGRNCSPTGGLCCVPQPDWCYLASANPKMILTTYEFDAHPRPGSQRHLVAMSDRRGMLAV
jgi:hypothetical protein